jgi:hypothetical protein
MDKVTIQEIATEIVTRLPYGDRYWLFLLVNVIVMALVGVLAVLGTSYFRTRGQNLATKHDFDELQKQLKATTETVETIKAEVGQKDWAQREWTNLRRTKLEALLEKMHDCETYLDQHTNRFLEGKGIDDQRRDPLSELSAIGTLYFPELKEEVSRFYLIGKTQIVAGLQLSQALGSAGDNLAARQNAFDTFRQKSSPIELAEARSALTDAARRLLVSIMGVDEHQ